MQKDATANVGRGRECKIARSRATSVSAVVGEEEGVTVTEGGEAVADHCRRTGVDLARAEIGRRLPRNWSALAVHPFSFPVLSDILSVLPVDSRQLDALWKRFRFSSRL